MEPFSDHWHVMIFVHEKSTCDKLCRLIMIIMFNCHDDISRYVDLSCSFIRISLMHSRTVWPSWSLFMTSRHNLSQVDFSWKNIMTCQWSKKGSIVCESSADRSSLTPLLTVIFIYLPTHIKDRHWSTRLVFTALSVNTGLVRNLCVMIALSNMTF
jgi:hypothetical protein